MATTDLAVPAYDPRPAPMVHRGHTVELALPSTGTPGATPPPTTGQIWPRGDKAGIQVQ